MIETLWLWTAITCIILGCQAGRGWAFWIFLMISGAILGELRRRATNYRKIAAFLKSAEAGKYYFDAKKATLTKLDDK